MSTTGRICNQLPMRDRKPLILWAFALTTAVGAVLGFESKFFVSIEPRPLDIRRPAVSTRAGSALDLRLVDSGGVGIPLEGNWGTDYSHDRRVFHEVILKEAPFVNAVAFQRVEREWRAYVERMQEYGNNAISVPLFLELIDFDRGTSPGAAAAEPVYSRDDHFRVRHEAVRRSFVHLFEWAARRGMRVFLETDMLRLTPPLASRLRLLAPAPAGPGIDAGRPEVWTLYRQGLEEIFERIPSIAGLVVRFGEGGDLYNTAGWPYRSEVAVRRPSHLRAMLQELLPAFEASHKLLVLRSWTVGVGALGRLHFDPALYQNVLGDIDSPALVVSTKFTAGDFFSYLPLNPTLVSGRHRRIVELQAKPEFEGFGAFPNFLGHEHARALRQLSAENPRIIGTYLLTQAGGPLRAGPRTLYPTRGFWWWTDANVFVDSRLAVDPSANVDRLVDEWARANFGGHPQLAAAVTQVLATTRQAVLEGFYIRPFAEQMVRVPGLELPPLMWIFEWDIVGGWHSLLSVLYCGTRHSVDRAIEEGNAAAAAVREAHQRLREAFAVSTTQCGDLCESALRSLEYQQTLFEALAAWRQVFLSYYRWLETGDADAWRRWHSGRGRFAAAASEHSIRFGRDPEFPAFDLTSATQAIVIMDRSQWIRPLAALVAGALIVLLAIGSPLGRRWQPDGFLQCPRRLADAAWTAAMTPRRLGKEPIAPGIAASVAALTIVLVALLVAAVTGFASVSPALGAVAVLCVVAFVYATASLTAGARGGRGRSLIAPAAPLLPGLIAMFVAIAYLGPLGFWYGLWIVPVFRAVMLTALLVSLMRSCYAMVALRADDGWQLSVAATSAALGAGLVALVLVLPDWINVLRALNRPLNVAPATDTLLFALRSYAGVSLAIGNGSLVIGGTALIAGFAVCSWWPRVRFTCEKEPGGFPH